MCGHVGIAGKLEFKDEATMKRLLIFDYLRGPDSTGMATVKNNGDATIVKMASHPIDLFDTKKFNDALTGAGALCFLGHNRLATKGKVTGVNAHPYQFEHIIGAHNGTLDWSSVQDLEKATGDKFDVDSQAIFNAIAKLGVEATVPMLKGAWALVWIDLNEGSLNFLRNKERPFWIAYSKEFDKVFWASESPILHGAIHLSQVGYEMFKDDKNHQYFSTKIDWWYKYNLEELKKGFEGKPKPRVKELKGKEPTPAVTYTCGTGAPFNHRNQNNAVTHLTPNKNTSTTSTTTSRGNGRADTRVTHIPPDVIRTEGSTLDPFSGLLTLERFNEIAKNGCSWCSSEVSYGQPGVVVMDHGGHVLCPDCSGKEKESRLYTYGHKMLVWTNEQKKGKAA